MTTSCYAALTRLGKSASLSESAELIEDCARKLALERMLKLLDET